MKQWKKMRSALQNDKKVRFLSGLVVINVILLFVIAFYSSIELASIILTTELVLAGLGFYVVIQFGAWLRKLARNKRHCFFVKMEQAVRVDTGDGDFLRFYFFSDKYVLQGQRDPDLPALEYWRVVKRDPKQDSDIPRGTVEHFNWFQRLLYRWYGIVWFQGWLFQRSIHFYDFVRSEWELDRDTKEYKLETYEKDKSPYYYTKKFPLAFLLSDAEDQHGLPVNVYFTIYGYIENLYTASIGVDNYPDIWQQTVLGAAAQFVGQHSLLLLSIHESEMKEDLNEEGKQQAKSQKQRMRDLFSIEMRKLNEQIEQAEQDPAGIRPELGLSEAIGAVITDADINIIEPGKGVSKEAIRASLLKEFDARMDMRAATHKAEAEKIIGEGIKVRAQKEVAGYGEKGLQLAIAKEIRESKLRTLVLGNRNAGILVSEHTEQENQEKGGES